MFIQGLYIGDAISPNVPSPSVQFFHVAMSSPTKDPIGPSHEMETTEEPQSPQEPLRPHESEEPLEAHISHEHAEAVEDTPEHEFTIENPTTPDNPTSTHIGAPIENVAHPQHDPDLNFDDELRVLVSRIVEATRASVVLGDGSPAPDADSFSGDIHDLVAKYVGDFPVSSRKPLEKEAILSPLKTSEGDQDKYYSDLQETVVSQQGRLGNLEKTVKALREDITKTKFDSNNVADQLASMAEDAQAVEKHNEELKMHARNLATAKIATEQKLRQIEEELEQERGRSYESELKYQQLFDTIKEKKEELVEELLRRQYPPLPEEEMLSRHYKDQLWDYTIDGMARVANQALDDLEEEERLIKTMREEMKSRRRYLPVIPRESRGEKEKKPEDEPETVIARLERRINDQDRRADVLQRMLDKAKAEREVNTANAVSHLTAQIDDALDRLYVINTDLATAEEVRDLAIAQVKDSEAKISLLEKALLKIKGVQSPFSAKSPVVGKDAVVSQDSSIPDGSQAYSDGLPGDLPPTTLAAELAELQELTSHEIDRRSSLISNLGLDPELPRTPRPTSELLTLRGLKEERDRLTEQLEKCGENGRSLKKQLEKSQRLREDLSQDIGVLKEQLFKFTAMAASEANGLRSALREAETELAETRNLSTAQETKHTERVSELTRKIEELTDQLENAISLQSKDSPPEVETLRLRVSDLEQQLLTVREEVTASITEGYDREANKLAAKIQELQEQLEKQVPAATRAEIERHLATIAQLQRKISQMGSQRVQEADSDDVFSTPETLVAENKFLRNELEKLKDKVDPFRQKDRITDIRVEKRKLEALFGYAGIPLDPFGFDQAQTEEMRRYNALCDEEDLCHMIIRGINPARQRLRTIHEDSLKKIAALEEQLLQARENKGSRWLDGTEEVSDSETKEELRRELEDTKRQLETSIVLHSVRAQHARTLLDKFEEDKAELLKWSRDVEEDRQRTHRTYIKPEDGKKDWNVKPRPLIGKEEELRASALVFTNCYGILKNYGSRLSIIAGLPPEKVPLRITELKPSIQELEEHHSAVTEAIGSLNSKLDEGLTSPGNESTPLLQSLIDFLTQNTRATSNLHQKMQDAHLCQLMVSREIDDLYGGASMTIEQTYAVLQRKNEYQILRMKIKAQHDAALKIRDKLQSQYSEIMKAIGFRRDEVHKLSEEGTTYVFEAMAGNSVAIKAFGKFLDRTAGTIRSKLRSFQDSIAADLSDAKLRLHDSEKEVEDKKAESSNRKERLSPDEEKILQEKIQYVEVVREEKLRYEELLDTLDDIRYYVQAEDELLQLRDTELKEIEKRRVELEGRIFDYTADEREREQNRAIIEKRIGPSCPPEEIEKELDSMWAATRGRPWMSLPELESERTALALRATDLLDAQKAHPFLHRSMIWPMSERILRYYPFNDKDPSSKVKALEDTTSDEPLERFAEEVVRWRNEKVATLEVAQQYISILQSQLGYLGVKLDAAETKIEHLRELVRERTAHLRGGAEEKGAEEETEQNPVVGEPEPPKSPLIFASDPYVTEGERLPTAKIDDASEQQPPPIHEALFEVQLSPGGPPVPQRPGQSPNIYSTHDTSPDVSIRPQKHSSPLHSPPRMWSPGKPLPALGPDRFFPSLNPMGSSYAEIHQRVENRLQAEKKAKKTNAPGTISAFEKAMQQLERTDREFGKANAPGHDISDTAIPEPRDAMIPEKEPPKRISPRDLSLSELQRIVDGSRKAKAMNPPVPGPRRPRPLPQAEQQPQGGFKVSRGPLPPGSHQFEVAPLLPPRAPQPQQAATERPADEEEEIEMPVTRGLVTQHSTQQPAAQKPTAQPQDPSTQHPSTQQLVVQKPPAQKPSIEQRETQKPATQQQPAKQPAAQKRVTQKPAAKKPAPQKPTSQQPSTQQDTSKQPATQQQSTRQSATQRLATQGPITEKPDTQRPTTQQPATKKRGTKKPTTKPPTTRKDPESGVDIWRQYDEEDQPEAGPSEPPKDKGKGKAPISKDKPAQRGKEPQKTKLPLLDQVAISERLQQLERDFVQPRVGCGNHGGYEETDTSESDDDGLGGDNDEDDTGGHGYGGCGGYSKGHHEKHPRVNMGKYPEFRNQLKDLDDMIKDGTKKAQDEIAQLDEEMRKAERERLSELEDWIDKEVWKVDFHKKVLEEGRQALEKSPAYVSENEERDQGRHRRCCGHNSSKNDQARTGNNCPCDPTIGCGCDCNCQFHRSHACVLDYNCKKSIARGPITGALAATRQHAYEHVRAYVRLIRLILVFFLWLTHLPDFIFTKAKRYLVPPFLRLRRRHQQHPPVPEPPLCWPCFQAKDAVYIFYHVLLLMTIQVYVAASRERELWLFGNSRLKAAYGHNLQYGIPYFAWFFRVDPRLTLTRYEFIAWACSCLDTLLGILGPVFDGVAFALELILEQMNVFFWRVVGRVVGHGPLGTLWRI